MIQNKHMELARQTHLEKIVQFAVVLRTMFSVCLDSVWVSIYRHNLKTILSSSMPLEISGDVVPKDVNAAVATIKTKRTIQFVDWHLARIFIPKRRGARFCEVQDVEHAKLRRSNTTHRTEFYC